MWSENFLYPESPSEHFAALLLALYEIKFEVKHVLPLESLESVGYVCSFQRDLCAQPLEVLHCEPHEVLRLKAARVLQCMLSEEQSRSLCKNQKVFEQEWWGKGDAKSEWRRLQSQHKALCVFFPKNIAPLLRGGLVGGEAAYYNSVLSEKVNPAWSEKQQEMWVAQKCALLSLGGDGGLILKLQEAVRTGLDVSNIGRRAQAMCARFALEGGTAVEDAVGVIESSIEAVKLGQMVGHRKEKGAMRL